MKQWKLKMNIKKTKVMIPIKHKKERKMSSTNIGNQSVEKTKQFCYLGSIITNDNMSIIENKSITCEAIFQL